ncbi:translation elongation factor 4 [Patescibacteria group bacterium]|nr:translation elongation factor 4 [Patescibacteria group bacterium]
MNQENKGISNGVEIRNFVIISHVDHGKSTLADRFLDITQSVASRKMRSQYLDSMDLEREKGITIKMQPVRMHYKNYILNLIDTPGHVDFGYEVSRSLAAVEGAVLLVDAGQGIQAQTLANLELAKKQGLVIIPVINKIDLPHANIPEAEEELGKLLAVTPEEIIKISAKSGKNIEEVLKAVIEKVPAPCGKPGLPQNDFRALIFDSVFDSYKGVIAYVRVMDGEIKKTDKIKLIAGDISSEIKELGYFLPELSPESVLKAGEIGYIATGIKEPGKVRVGDTIVNSNEVRPRCLEGYQEVKPMIYASLYPESSDDFDLLKEALSKLKLSDPALVFEPETKESLGRGFRCGFLGTLHAEIISERLHREYGLELVISSPSVVYKVNEKLIYSAGDWPNQVASSEEPWVELEVISPARYIGKIIDLLKDLRGTFIGTEYITSDRAVLTYEIPLREVIINLYDKIKGVTQGYGSMNYKFTDFRPANLSKMEILIAGTREPAFSKIVPEEKIFSEGRALVKKLKESLPPQQFSVPIQAAIGGKVIARETLGAKRKDVTGALYGGDYSRKKKLLEKQKKGKKILKEKGSIRIPPKVFLEIFRS